MRQALQAVAGGAAGLVQRTALRLLSRGPVVEALAAIFPIWQSQFGGPFADAVCRRQVRPSAWVEVQGR